MYTWAIYDVYGNHFVTDSDKNNESVTNGD